MFELAFEFILFYQVVTATFLCLVGPFQTSLKVSFPFLNQPLKVLTKARILFLISSFSTVAILTVVIFSAFIKIVTQIIKIVTKSLIIAVLYQHLVSTQGHLNDLATARIAENLIKIFTHQTSVCFQNLAAFASKIQFECLSFVEASIPTRLTSVAVPNELVLKLALLFKKYPLTNLVTVKASLDNYQGANRFYQS